jgi:hypothetical protein
MKGPMEIQDIIATLPSLSAEELAEISIHIKALTSVDHKADEDDWFLSGVLYLLEERGLGETIPNRFRISNKRQFRGYLPKSRKLRKTLEDNIRLTKVDRIGMGRILARCLADYIEDFMEVSLSSLLYHADLALPALEKAFPGYLAAGMLRVVLTQKISHET